MKAKTAVPCTIDEYIAGFPPEIQALLRKVRSVVKRAAPEAEETISYRMPTFKLEGNLVHFAAFKNHIGFFPTPTGVAEFKKDLAAYKGSKGSVQFPFDRPVPYALMGRIVKFRVRENLQLARAKAAAHREGRRSRRLGPVHAGSASK